MPDRNTLALALLVAGLVLLVAPALVPVQPVLYHHTGAATTASESELRQRNVTVVAYEELSPRGKELYVATLEADGEYTVPDGTGAPAFDYTPDDRHRELVVERPSDADLPPADEPLGAAEHYAERAAEREAEERGATPTTPSEAEIERHRRQIARYDAMATYRGTPPLTGPRNLVRLLSVVLGVLGVATGGYLRSRP